MTTFKSDSKILNERLADLDCIAIETCNGYVLARRDRDHTFITWSYMIRGGEAILSNGHYDMNLESGVSSLYTRSGVYVPVTRAYNRNTH